jgi:hypothetical protein
MPAIVPMPRTPGSVMVDCDDALGRPSQLTVAFRAGRVRLVAPPGQTITLDAANTRRLVEILLQMRQPADDQPADH